jgi:hypothetical protein
LYEQNLQVKTGRSSDQVNIDWQIKQSDEKRIKVRIYTLSSEHDTYIYRVNTPEESDLLQEIFSICYMT